MIDADWIPRVIALDLSTLILDGSSVWEALKKRPASLDIPLLAPWSRRRGIVIHEVDGILVLPLDVRQLTRICLHWRYRGAV